MNNLVLLCCVIIISMYIKMLNKLILTVFSRCWRRFTKLLSIHETSIFMHLSYKWFITFVYLHFVFMLFCCLLVYLKLVCGTKSFSVVQVNSSSAVTPIRWGRRVVITEGSSEALTSDLWLPAGWLTGWIVVLRVSQVSEGRRGWKESEDWEEIRWVPTFSLWMWQIFVKSHMK